MPAFADRPFTDRYDAGRVLADRLTYLRGTDGLLVLGLARGGVPVAWEVANVLHAPLDVCVIRKLGVPGHEELAMGALAYDGRVLLNSELISMLEISTEQVQAAVERETQELRRRTATYRAGREPLELTGRTVILVDDGIATGASMRAAVRATRGDHPARIVVAVPVGPPSARRPKHLGADEVVCVTAPADFTAVGQAFIDFGQTTDEEVCRLLATRP